MAFAFSHTARARKVMRWMRPCVDMAMTVTLVLQMAPGKTGNLAHEVSGIVLVLLFGTHHALNRGWLRRLRRSRGGDARLLLATDVVLACGMVGTALTGVLMSRSAMPWLCVPSFGHVARPLHGTCAYASFMACGLHMGMHFPAIRGYVGRHDSHAHTPRNIRGTLYFALFALGIWAFMQLDVANKLMGRPSFPDGTTPLPLQVLLHVSLLPPLISLGSWAQRALHKRKDAS